MNNKIHNLTGEEAGLPGLCPTCGADLKAWREMFGEQHRHYEQQKSQSYNGWSNYETWAVNLWLGNDVAGCALQQELLEQAQNTPNPSEVWTKEEATRFTLADLLKEFITDNNPLVGAATMYTDLLGAAIAEVNFTEIARNLLDTEFDWSEMR